MRRISDRHRRDLPLSWKHGCKAGPDGADRKRAVAGFVMRVVFIGLLIVVGLFGGALVRTETVMACPARTTPHFPGSNFGVFAAYEALDRSTKAQQARALALYFYTNCSDADSAAPQSSLVRAADHIALMAVSPFVSFDAPFLVIQLQSQP
jgi:hypothetical protein